ncbi:uncharacterized protein LOC124278326 [Haliotis rubra]|uniref:uncharacterized protein LOC124278326 n=1 Tax=Haliotis rubra TaxID=36100 RepID=UPI001EE57581|nr:uncharacterized protein LOC124278326 [Haliotis rubra]XP_046570003.1 uncharacterized protein LOC124278326 [Haliotis rubra]XP_046570004.1 uncharacterized protein LOC124278326 [Haliotis rubra]XP_046570005.1 uncharacterized protein LOC124278326 [Haliotis rubra]XP_046570006.1 uncharacterized protein LOC124278326 [Haliotis rubra]XP_046570007.1 uncharacterized protein LOC124278326 [Haliotis rubra]
MSIVMMLLMLVLLGVLNVFRLATGVEPSYNLCDVKQGFTVNGDYFPEINDTSRVYINLTGASPEAKYHCFMRFTTCNNCSFRVEPIGNFRYQNCLWNNMLRSYGGQCAPGCTYLQLFDPDYMNETSRAFTSTPWPQTPFYTLSKKIYIVVCSDRSMVKDIHLSLQLTVVEKKKTIRGSAYDPPSDPKYITSPAFPNFYTENDEVYIYQFTAVNSDEYIVLNFDDWNMSPRSILWFLKSDIVGPIYGSSSRPVVVSDGPELTVKFRTGTQLSSSNRNFIGFKATYSFENNRRHTERPITDCGGFLKNKEGGVVTFNPVMSTNEYYDCIWVIQRHSEYSMVQVKIVEYDSSPMYYPQQRDRVEIRGGLTSLGGQVALVKYENLDRYKNHGFVNNSGFYIRLQGRYQNARDFVLAYSSYSYGACRSRDFKCFNGRCISDDLTCDSYDHCGDNSDERSSLCGVKDGEYSRYSYTISIGVIIPMVISIFLIVVICLLIIFIRRCRTLSQQTPLNGRQPISSVSGNMARRNRRGRNRSRIRMNLTIQQDAPPSYDEVIQNTPIGYLNMAFMWSQPDVNNGLVNPPTYEEATSPTDVPRLTASQNVLNQSADSTSSTDSLESHSCDIPRASDTSSDGSQMERHLCQASFSSDSTVAERDCYPPRDSSVSSAPVHEESGRTNQQRFSKPVDEFIECPVSSSTLGNKDPKPQSESEAVREQGAAACPGQGDSQGQGRSRDSLAAHGKDRDQTAKRKKKSSRNRSEPDHPTEPEPRPPSDRPRQRGRRGRQSDSSHSPSHVRDSSAEGGEVVLRVPSTAVVPAPSPRRHRQPEREEQQPHDDRLRGTYLSLSLDTGDGGDPDIFV